MYDEAIQNLKDALRFSPDNIPLKSILAETLLKANRLDEAEQAYMSLITLTNDAKAKFGLAKTFFQKEAYAKANVILEELIDKGDNNHEIYILHAKALIHEDDITKAIEIYRKALALNPQCQDAELDAQLRQVNVVEEVGDVADNAYFIQHPSIDFAHVGGMEEVKKEIDLKIIKPLLHPELYKAYGKKTGGGILLYGPPGCGKTYIAKATAGQVKARFISVGLNDILDMWIGNSEKNLHHIFEIARQNTPCVLFFDEIDALGASRSDMRQSSGRHLINQFLQELDGVENENDGILIMGATNTPWHLDQAFRRPGRFDRIVFVPPPDNIAREAILKIKLAGKPTSGIDYHQIAKKMEQYSGADIEALIDKTIEDKLTESFNSGVPQPIAQQDLLSTLKRHKPSTAEWFSTAKNFALFANESGLYDDILTYMKIKK